jgi:hypothetical protein
MAEVNAALQQLLHIDNAQIHSSLFFLRRPHLVMPALSGDKLTILRRAF